MQIFRTASVLSNQKLPKLLTSNLKREKLNNSKLCFKTEVLSSKDLETEPLKKVIFELCTTIFEVQSL